MAIVSSQLVDMDKTIDISPHEISLYGLSTCLSCTLSECVYISGDDKELCLLETKTRLESRIIKLSSLKSDVLPRLNCLPTLSEAGRMIGTKRATMHLWKRKGILDTKTNTKSDVRVTGVNLDKV